MKVSVHTRRFTLGDPLMADIEKHLIKPLQRHFDRSAAELLIEITHHPAKRDDQEFECRVVFYVPASPALCVSESSNDVRLAIDRMHHRLLRLVDRYLDRLRGSRFPKKYYAARVYEEQLESSEEREPEEPEGTPAEREEGAPLR